MNRLFRPAGSFPLVEAVRWYQTPAILKCFAERRFVEVGFGTGVNHLLTDARIFRPVRDQTPAHQRELPNSQLLVLTDDANVLSGSNVVAWLPIDLVHRIEILGNQLLSSR